MKDLIFIGGGHAQLESLKNTEKYRSLGLDVKLISPNAFTYYSGMGPGLLGGLYEPEETRFNVKKLVESGEGTFIQDKVVKIDPVNQKLYLESKKEVKYDLISIDVGSVIFSENLHIEGDKFIPVKPIENLIKIKSSIISGNLKDLSNIIIVGGGPAGIEIATNLNQLKKTINKKINIKIISDTKILESYPSKVREIALQSLNKKGIQVYESKKVEKILDNKIYLDDGTSEECDLGILATGVKPVNILDDSGIPQDQDGSMIVNSHLQSIKYENIFGGGDCINMKDNNLDKVGVYAVRENPILYKNLLNFVKGKPLIQYTPQENYLLILNMGNKKGLAWKGNTVLKGKMMFYLKNFIDKRFMRKFQL
ncbi:MAG: pyridine nucleotide-disulfide oxidoreductase [Candidatus Lokiarchaeota archaeon]|nr:pyridine nucleotide-disulfide oxidoreductase [Candidatus Lokiarchaeota archaeon]MBD3198923.1 pyridine nucleotide-disulfide oxidoreductase [Candidatus Lokiarchaeota archaeon]